MPIPTPKRPGPPRQPERSASRSWTRAAQAAAAAAAYAAAELALTILVGRFFSWGRAEALLFFAFRPWLLLVAAVLARRFDRRGRFTFYAGSLLLAALSESLFLLALGAADPWMEALRGVAAGAALLLLFDLILQAGDRFGGRLGRSAATGALVLLLVVPKGLRPYEVIVLGREPSVADAPKRDLMLMSALPLIWGEKGPLDPSSRPAAAYQALAREFRIRPLDVLDDGSLAGGRLLLVAQPRALAPTELVALDSWVRRGGRALVLTDPRLVWPSELPLGDIRRAPAIGLLDPLLTHWGLRLEAPAEPVALSHDLDLGGHGRRLILFAAGSFASSGDCRIGPVPQIARCRLGRGEAILLADADMMHDRLWVGQGSRGTERHARLSDNPLVLADWLDLLAGERRRRLQAPVEWLDRAADRRPALLLALLPLILAAAPAAGARLRRRG